MRETVKQQQKVKIPSINFIPTTAEEVEHLQRLKELLSRKRSGDWNLVAEKLDLPTQTVYKAFVRVYSKYHVDAVNALEAVIEERIKRLNPQQNEN
ncbi:hypothetical protein IQN75_00670 [Elizabethkingia anophelis]|uniref:hypothetical protein n=1 Tax=Elizabethkingia anophelis TaxID=1117645 RepID=UPI00187E47C3|nr:hypothetical protein [Elizabethkingia anophelis]MBE9391926.1 hypothetical protein [Elizabethkingia anophelis]MBE9405366.1 hypothetical protein [Elizabethkingia anophelis]